MLLGWEPDGGGMFGVASFPWVVSKNISLQLSPGVAEARKVELLLLCLYSSHLNWCHFPSSLSKTQASEKEDEKRTDLLRKQRTKNLANKKESS